MKKYAYVGISFIILVFGILFVPRIINRIKNGAVVKNERPNAENTVKSGELAFIKIHDEPKKVPEFALLNQDSTMITHHDYKGKVYLVDFFFTHCPTICPKMTSNLKYISEQFENNEDFGIVSISIDPKRDTPMQLKKYAENYGIKHPNWNLLTGDRNDIYELANNGFTIPVMENENVPGGFEHSGYFALIDQDGYFRSRYDDMGNPIIFYRGTVSIPEKSVDGEEEQISILIEDIKKLLKNE